MTNENADNLKCPHFNPAFFTDKSPIYSTRVHTCIQQFGVADKQDNEIYNDKTGLLCFFNGNNHLGSFALPRTKYIELGKFIFLRFLECYPPQSVEMFIRGALPIYEAFLKQHGKILTYEIKEMKQEKEECVKNNDNRQ